MTTTRYWQRFFRRRSLNLLAVVLIGSLIPGLSGAAEPGAVCYVSLDGAGAYSGADSNNALAWQNGEGLKTCLASAVPGTSIYVAPGDYELRNRIQWDKSGEPGRPIRLVGLGRSDSDSTDLPIGDYGQSMLTTRRDRPTLSGTRPLTYSPETASEGNHFIQFEDGVSHVEISNFNTLNFRTVISADKVSTHAISVTNLYAENVRNLLSITTGCQQDICEFTATDWVGSNLHVLGVSKRVVRAEGLQNSTFQDITADVQDAAGQMHWDDWPLLFHFTGPSQQVRVERAIARNPVHRTGKAYDNGDCYTSEKFTSNLTFRNAHCLDAFDAAFDLKGGPHFIEDAIALRIGNRAFRVWDGPVYIKNALAAYDGDGEHTHSALGSNAAIWVRGEAVVEAFTSLSSTQPFILAESRQGCGSLMLSDSLVLLETQRRYQTNDARTLRPKLECRADNPNFVAISEDNVSYRNENSFAHTSLYNSLWALSGALSAPPARNDLSQPVGLLSEAPAGFIWPENLSPDGLNP